MRIGLLDFDGKIPNLALMKLSAYHKAQGHQVLLNDFTPSQVDKVYCSVLFTWNRRKADKLVSLFPNIEFGGTGWDIHKQLSPEIEALQPDYSLYTVEKLLPRLKGIKDAEKRLEKAQGLVDSGIGFTTRGCVRTCSFCLVPRKEGQLQTVGNIGQLLNERSNRLILLDNNLTADPDCIPKLNEMRDRKLRVSITQGIDIRLVTPEIAQALSQVKLLGRQLHYSWDSPSSEGKILSGIQTLSQFVSCSKHRCYMLCGYDTTWEEDMYRFQRLKELKIDPYVMLYNKNDGKIDIKLNHFARWVNGFFHRVCPDFEQYTPWMKVRDSYHPSLLMA